ncbi:pentapeptide repeat-containing protein [Lentzea sp. NPDC005914]|uniref:pentapeptide repeat-containing protein n=1 Tax=Lentzea sp. NPDC005914 TaxID=3154572 RepID=UPI0033F1F220
MDESERPYPVLSSRAIIIGGALLVVLGVGLAVLLMITLGDGQHANQLDAIKTAGTIVVGTGGAAALWLTARRQRTTEIGLNQKHVDQQVAERAHWHTELDSTARRITDLYGKAVEQIGSDKAAVRLAGFYALERLAQDNETQRQTIVNVLCAYLRMPSEGDPKEVEVQQTVQRILAAHLRADEKWWNPEIDLTGAILVDATFEHCVLYATNFTGVTFEGRTSFYKSQIGGTSTFTKARFAGFTSFDDAVFGTDADFTETTFGGSVQFDRAVFHQRVDLTGAVFEGESFFVGTTFNGVAMLGPATYKGFADFVNARFDGPAATWLGSTFEAGAYFGGAVLSGPAYFPESADVRGAQFAEKPWIAVPEEPPQPGPARYYVAQDGSGIVQAAGLEVPGHLSGEVMYLQPGMTFQGLDGSERRVFGTWDECVEVARANLVDRLGGESDPATETAMPINPVEPTDDWDDYWYSGMFVAALDQLAEPADLDQLATRGGILAEIGFATLAIADLDQVLAEQPWRPSEYSARAYAHGLLGHTEESERDFARAQALAPRHAWTFFRKALLSNDPADARKALEADRPSLRELQTLKAETMV